jgi:hypothetical protein
MHPTCVSIAEHVPGWVPETAQIYLDHTLAGLSFRALARARGTYASTIMRRVRRLEVLRDDPLVDEALHRIETRIINAKASGPGSLEPPQMQSDLNLRKAGDDPRVESEARRILRRLCETGAFLAIAPGMDQAVVLREHPGGGLNRIAVVAREIAQIFALKEWIEGTRSGKVGRYGITAVGRAALKRLLAADHARRHGTAPGFAEEARPFQRQHQIAGERWVMPEGGTRPELMRTNLAESPVAALGRKKGLDGAPFLSAAMVQAAERLREDFEVAQLGPRVTQNWDKFLTASVRHAWQPGGADDRPAAARDRVAAALAELGPGLADIAFRTCCFLEGLETAEKRLNWSARSGKVVLRIALGRLAQHYGIANKKGWREAA